MLLGHCNYPNINPNISIEGYENGLEDSQISYYCQSGFVPNKRMVTNCTRRGIWEPNPAELICQGLLHTLNTKFYNNSICL